MTTLIEQSELSTELQELHLKGKQWVSELDFQHTEMTFLQDLHKGKSSKKGSKVSPYTSPNVLSEINSLKNEADKLRSEISDFMLLVGKLSTVKDPDIEANLISKYTQIETTLQKNSVSFHKFKDLIFKREMNKI